jgi:hypothetical protein
MVRPILGVPQAFTSGARRPDGCDILSAETADLMKVDSQRRRVLRLVHDGVTGAIAWLAVGNVNASTATRGPFERGPSASRTNARPSELLANLLPEPLGVSAESLRFSWIVPSMGARTRQTAYRLQLAASSEGLRSKSALIWDSGRVVSDTSTAVPFSGGAL